MDYVLQEEDPNDHNPFLTFSFFISGVLVMGIGSITFSLPHFLTGNHMLSSLSERNNSALGNICVRNNPLMASANTHPSAGEELLMSLPGIEKIKSLTEGKTLPVNQYIGEPNSGHFYFRT